MEINEDYIYRIVKDAVNEALNEIELNEILSVAEPVDEEADRLLGLIDSNYKDVGTKEESMQGVERYSGTLKDYVFGVETDINFVVFVVKNRRIYEDNKREIFKPLMYNTKTNTLFLSYVIVAGEIDYQMVADDFGHELKHMYEELQKRQQPIQRTFERPDGKDIYKLATDIINSRDCQYYDAVIARLIYYSSRREQDAYLNGLYGELKKIGQPSAYAYGQTQFFKMIQSYEEKFRTFRSITNRDEVIAAVSPYKQEFGLSFSRLRNYFGPRLNRLRKKKDKVLKRYDMWYAEHYKLWPDKPSKSTD